MKRTTGWMLCACFVTACGGVPDGVATDGGDAAMNATDSSSPGADASSDAGTTNDTGTTSDAGTTNDTRLLVRVENIAPWTLLKSGAASMKTNGVTGPLASGEAFEVAFTAGHGQKLSFAAMFGESNDWFFAPGPDGIALFNADGTPVSGDVTSQIQLWNAGTEVDQEPAVGADTGPHQSAPDQGAPDTDPNVRAIGSTVALSAGGTFTVPSIASMIRVTLTPGADRHFTLRIENVSTATTLHTSMGDRGIHISPSVWAIHTGTAPLFTPGAHDQGRGLEQLAESGRSAQLLTSLTAVTGYGTPVSPGVFVVHASGQPLFALGSADRGAGLERIAENGSPMALDASLTAHLPAGASSHGVFNTPVGASGPGAATPGNAFEFELTAHPGDRLSFATMFGMSNDWIFATPADGVPLFDAQGAPVSGDVSAQIAIYDVGTEVNEELAVGPDVGPQQSMPDQGAPDPMAMVRAVPTSEYAPPATAHLRVTITAQRVR